MRGDLNRSLVMRKHYNEYLYGTWNVVPSQLPGLFKLKVDTNKNKENDENESCSTVNHDLSVLRSGIFDS